MVLQTQEKVTTRTIEVQSPQVSSSWTWIEVLDLTKDKIITNVDLSVGVPI